MQSRYKIEQTLLKELKVAQETYEQRRKEFAAVLAEIPSGILYPDGSARVINSRTVNSAALEVFTRALRAFDDFVQKGAIPEHLKDAEGS